MRNLLVALCWEAGIADSLLKGVMHCLLVACRTSHCRCPATASTLTQTQWPCSFSHAANLQHVLVTFVVLTCSPLWHEPAWAAHAAAAAVHGRLAANVAEVALGFVGELAASLAFPQEQRPAGCDWRSATEVARLLACPTFAAAGLPVYFRETTSVSAAASVNVAAQLAQLLPLEQPLPGYTQRQHSALAAVLAELPGLLCHGMAERPELLQQLTLEQQRQLAAQLLPAASRLPGVLQLVAGGTQVAQLPDAQLLRLAQLLCAARQQLNMLFKVVTSATGSSDSSSSGADGSGASSGASSGSSGRRDGSDGGTPIHAELVVSGLPTAAAWCRAAANGMRCIQWLQEVHDANQQAANWASHLPPAALFLAIEAATTMELAASQPIEADPAEVVDALRATWQLHTTACRLVHYSATAGTPVAELDGFVGALLSECLAAAVRLQALAEQGHSRGGEATCAAPGKRWVHKQTISSARTVAHNLQAALHWPAMAAAIGGTRPTACPVSISHAGVCRPCAQHTWLLCGPGPALPLQRS